MSTNYANICCFIIQSYCNKFDSHLLFSSTSLSILNKVVLSWVWYFSSTNLSHPLNHPKDKLSCNQLATQFLANYQNTIFGIHLIIKYNLQHVTAHSKKVCLLIFIAANRWVDFSQTETHLILRFKLLHCLKNLRIIKKFT